MGRDGSTPGGDFADLVRARRVATSLTQQDLADRSGLSVAVVRDIEQRRTAHPHPKSVRRLAQAFGLTGTDMLAFQSGPDDIRPDLDGSSVIGVLGPLSIQRGARQVAIASPRQRMILGRLALSPNLTVRRAELVDLVWEGAAPAAAGRLVRMYLSRIRGVVQPRQGPTAVVTSVPGAGYRLNAQGDRLDLVRFRELDVQARACAATAPASAVQILSEAHALWRGDPVADLDALQEHPLVTALGDERIASTLLFADLADTVGELGRVLPLLRGLGRRYPLHEPIHGRLILALAATGLQAEALRVFDDLRQRLADEFGIDPSRELTEYWQRVLRQQWQPARMTVAPEAAGRPPTRTRESDREPRCLPRRGTRLFGREAEIERAVQAIGEQDPLRPAVVVIDGMAGVGKSALALQLAHQFGAAFPDGHLFVDLHGHSEREPVPTFDALAILLGQLDLAQTQLPDGEEGRVAVWRSALAGRRTIVVLDNASGVRQIEPLLPGEGAGLILVTSRTRLGPISGAWPLSLEPLDLHPAVAMLGEAVSERVHAEPEAAAEVATRCGRLPLALSLVAHRLQQRPQWSLASMCDRLRAADPAPIAIRAEGRSVAAAFEVSYQQLARPQQRLFRLLGLHPAGTFEAWPVAALTGLPIHEVTLALDHLVEVHLLQADTPGRYRLHDLLRDFAESAVLPSERTPAITRMLDYYLRTIVTAVEHFDDDAQGLPRDFPPDTPMRPFDAVPARLAWLRAEWPTVVSLGELTHREGAHYHACMLLRAVWRFAWHHGHSSVVADRLGPHALSSAAQLGDRTVLALTHRKLAGAYYRVGRPTDTLTHLEFAEALHRDLGERRDMAQIALNRATLYRASGRFRDGLRQDRNALRLARSVDDAGLESYANLGIGMTENVLGRHEAALTHIRRALASPYRHHSLSFAGLVIGELARVHLAAGHARLALLLLARARKLRQQIGDLGGVAELLSDTGRAHAALGDLVTALRCQREAYEQLRGTTGWCFEAIIANDMGTSLTRLGRYDEAIDTHRRAMASAVLKEQVYEIARAHAGLAAAHRAAGLDGADAVQETALRMFLASDIPRRTAITLSRGC